MAVRHLALASATAPSSPVDKQLWYDETADLLKRWDATAAAWKAVGTGTYQRLVFIDVTHPDYGADKTGATDSTTAIQAAITAAGDQIGTDANTRGAVVFFPKGIYLTSAALTFPAGGTVTLQGAGRGPTHLKNSTSDLFSLDTYSIHVRDMLITSAAGGGHIVSQSGNTSNCVFRNVKLVQNNDAKSIWDNNGHGMLECYFTDFSFQLTQTATVPGWNLRAPSSDISQNVWENGRALYSGNYVFFIGHTNTSGFNYGNVFRNINFEVTNGGNIKLESSYGALLENLLTYDLSTVGATTNDLYSIGKGTASASSSNMLVNVFRIGGTLGTGLHDVNLNGGANTSKTTLINVDATATSSINLQYTVCTLLGQIGTVATPANETRLTDGLLKLRDLSVTRTGARAATASGSFNFEAGASGEVPVTATKVGTSTADLYRAVSGGATVFWVNHVGDVRTTRRVSADVGLGVGNSAAATTLGSVTKKIEIFDTAGASLGFIPVYDAIT